MGMFKAGGAQHRPYISESSSMLGLVGGGWVRDSTRDYYRMEGKEWAMWTGPGDEGKMQRTW